MLPQLITFTTLLTLASAHFRLQEPYWRGDSFASNRSQWTWPCAGVSQENSTTNRTAWPLTGGTVRANVSHEWAFTYINLGLGEAVTSFNVSLVEGFNQTGAGIFCISETGREALAGLNLTDGQPASVQIIQISHSGASLYNCADIVFRTDATIAGGDTCQNSTGVGGVELASVGSETCKGGAPSPGGAAGGSSTPGAAAAVRPGFGQLLVGVVAVGVAAFVAF